MKVIVKSMWHSPGGFAWELITEHVAKAFPVSPDVVEKRMEKDGIKRSI